MLNCIMYVEILDKVKSDWCLSHAEGWLRSELYMLVDAMENTIQRRIVCCITRYSSEGDSNKLNLIPYRNSDYEFNIPLEHSFRKYRIF